MVLMYEAIFESQEPSKMNSIEYEGDEFNPFFLDGTRRRMTRAKSGETSCLSGTRTASDHLRSCVQLHGHSSVYQTGRPLPGQCGCRCQRAGHRCCNRFLRHLLDGGRRVASEAEDEEESG